MKTIVKHGLMGIAALVVFAMVHITLAVKKSPEDILHYENPERGCTVILVGKNASTDGSTMATHSADCGVCDWTWRHIPAEQNEPGGMHRFTVH